MEGSSKEERELTHMGKSVVIMGSRVGGGGGRGYRGINGNRKNTIKNTIRE